MQGRQPIRSGGGFQLPPLTPLTRNVLIALFVLYTVELMARNLAGAPIDVLRWYLFGQGFSAWQPLTRYLIQGQGVLGVVLAGVVVYFFLPVMERMFSLRQVAEALACGAAGGTALGLALDLLGLAGGSTGGWAPLVTVLIVLFGLKIPDATILLFFVLPVPAKVLAWGTGVIAFLLLLASFDLSSIDLFGTWLGAVGWWYWRGPAGQKRRLLRKASQVERELNRFQVLDGGKRGARDQDDWIH